MCGIAVEAWRLRSARGAVYLLAGSLAIMLYSLGYAFELGSSSIQAVSFWLRVECLGSSLIAPMLLALTLTYAGRRRGPSPLGLMTLLAIPALTIIFAWTNEHHELMWADLELMPLGDYFVTAFTRGTWYWVSSAYNLILLTVSFVLLTGSFVRETGLYRAQFGLMLAGLSVPLLSFLLYLLGLIPEHIDPNPYALILTALFLAWGLLDYRFMDIMPVAREQVLASMTEAIIVTDSQNRLVELNPAAQRLLNVSAREAIGLPFSQILPPAWSEALSPYLDLQEARAEVAVDWQGRQHFYDLCLSPLRSGSKRHMGCVLSLHDITERVLTRQALQEANQRLLTLREVDADLMHQLDISHVCMTALEAARRITKADIALIGLARGQAVHIVHGIGNLPDGLVGSSVPLDKGISGRAIRTRQIVLVRDVSQDPDYLALVPSTQAQLSIPLLSGEKLIGILTLESACPDCFSDGALESLLLLTSHAAVAIDNAQSHAEREKLIEELDAFARTTAHDLKNPLYQAIVSAEMLRDRCESMPADERHYYLSIITASTRKMQNIIDSLLLLARVRDEEIVIGPLDMGPIVAEAIARLSLTAKEHKAEIIYPDDWPAALGYALWVEEIWANYISNAIQYGGVPPRVELGFDEPKGETICFWVRDNGPGISPEDQAKLFKPFARLDKSRGHGLGLSIALRIAERLGGTAGVRSEKGNGSVFYFTLPAAPSPDAAQSADPQHIRATPDLG